MALMKMEMIIEVQEDELIFATLKNPHANLSTPGNGQDIYLTKDNARTSGWSITLELCQLLMNIE